MDCNKQKRKHHGADRDAEQHLGAVAVREDRTSRTKPGRHGGGRGEHKQAGFTVVTETGDEGRAKKKSSCASGGGLDGAGGRRFILLGDSALSRRCAPNLAGGDTIVFSC